jgi:hypothetical protein
VWRARSGQWAWKYHSSTDTPDANGDILTWDAPDHGHATRRPPLKQAKTTRGFSVFKNVVVYYESVLEQRVSSVIQARNDVAELHSQYPVVSYVGADGNRHLHTFDYYVVFKDGHRVAVAVKYEAKRAEMLDLLWRIKSADIKHVADDVALMTQSNATLSDFQNATAIMWSRAHHDDREVADLLEIVCDLPGQFRFGELLRGCRNVANRRVAIWRLIDALFLVPLHRELITENSWLGLGDGKSTPSDVSR